MKASAKTRIPAFSLRTKRLVELVSDFSGVIERCSAVNERVDHESVMHAIWRRGTWQPTALLKLVPPSRAQPYSWMLGIAVGDQISPFEGADTRT